MKISTLGLSLVLIGVLGGCGRDSTGPTPSYVGTYALATVNNAALPVPYFPPDPSPDVMIAGGTLTLRANKSFTETLTLRRFFPATGVTELFTWVKNGTYTVVGSQVTFAVTPGSSGTGSSYAGPLNADNLSYTFDTLLYAYRKTTGSLL